MSDGPSHEPVIVVRGDRVGLGPISRDHLPLYTRWLNDITVFPGVGTKTPQTFESEEAWYTRAATETAGNVNFAVYDLSDMAVIGTTGLASIDHANHAAEFGIMLGDRRNQGLGTETTRLALDWGFTMLGLHSIMLGAWAWNTGAIRAYEKAGFREYGRRREAVWSWGRFWDVVYMDILASEFGPSVIGALGPGRQAPSGS